MARVTLPLLFKDLTGGVRDVEVDGATVGQVVAALESRFPGLADKMVTGGKLAPIVTVTVDGKIAAEGLETRVGQASLLAVFPSFGGG